MENKIVLRGKKIVGGKACGTAMVTTEPLCFFPLMDRDTGVITDTGHPLYGRSVSGKILVYPTGKGSTGTTYGIYDMVSIRGTGPKALLMEQAEPISTIGAIMAEIPVIASFEEDIFQIIHDGDFLEIDGDNGTVTVYKPGDTRYEGGDEEL